MKNRLNLNFALQTQEERTQFISQYLKQIKFTPTESELDTIAKYILWGKDSEGQTIKQTGEIDLETAHKTWDTKEIESLDGLYESENFTEALVRPLNSVRPLIRKPTFSRDSVPHTPEFLELWAQIDETEFLTQSYELTHGRRTKPIRSELLSAISQADQEKLYARALTLSEKNYLKLRHYLVELRTEQYTLRDSYVTLHQIHSPMPYSPSELAYFATDIPILPNGLLNIHKPLLLQGKEIATASPIGPPPSAQASLYFDFSNIDHLYSFTSLYDEIYDMEQADPESTFSQFLETFEFYHQFAELTPIQEDVLQLKMRRASNLHIMNFINKKYGTTYNSNYISTIYKQKALMRIADAAKLYSKIISALDDPSNFKTCNTCGRTLLICEEYFMHKAKSKDGFGTKCKKCSKLARNSK